ncbi:hypothetical protein ORD22_03030 [Sporosarcina sp. GW1-11]|uniref:hypothetical protein n=1 Tax=Sporosarcina sp. GW1-11 TaxID=2899126 RepID=UPI00294C5143|nr:hypothetical protein [Sporosarcina sp. GW1-11]MDV6377233.1 hypothetical protein [Sporosarcina sp. GW1-11]
MNRCKNDKGYALIIVLFAIVFIMITSAVFMRGALSNAKQENIIDTNNLAFMAAEMGVDYYKWNYINKYNDVKGQLWEDYKEKYSVEKMRIQSSGDINKDQQLADLPAKIREDAVKALWAILDNYTITSANLAGEKYSFTDKDFNIVQDLANYSVSISGDVQGEYQGKDKMLNFKLLFTMPKFDEDENENSGSQSSGGVKDLAWFVDNDLPFIPNPSWQCPSGKQANVTGKKCVFSDVNLIGNANNSTLYFDGDATKAPNGNLGGNVNGSKFYVTGEIASFNLNNMENGEFYAKGNIAFKNMNNIINVNVFTKGDFSAEQVDLSGSFVAMGGNFKPSKHVKLTGNSVLAIRNDWKANSSSQEIASGSKACVGGSVNLKEITVSGTGKLYYVAEKANTAGVTIIPGKHFPISKSAYDKDPNNLFKNCQGGGNVVTDPDAPVLNEPAWIDPRIEVDYY